MRAKRVGRAFLASCFAAGVIMAAVGMPSAPVRAAQARSGSSAQAVVNLNRASEQELTAVPGIGPSLARRIVEFREQNGPFRRVEDLLKVRGIGEKSLEKLRPHIKVEPAK